MLPNNCRWRYGEYNATHRTQWLRLERGAMLIAAFLFEWKKDGQIDEDCVSLRINADGATKEEVFLSLRDSEEVDKDVRRSLWDLQEELAFFCASADIRGQLYYLRKKNGGAAAENGSARSPEEILRHPGMMSAIIADRLVSGGYRIEELEIDDGPEDKGGQGSVN